MIKLMDRIADFYTDCFCSLLLLVSLWWREIPRPIDVINGQPNAAGRIA